MHAILDDVLWCKKAYYNSMHKNITQNIMHGYDMIQSFRAFSPIAHCNHSLGFSMGTAESHAIHANGIHVRLCNYNTVIM